MTVGAIATGDRWHYKQRLFDDRFEFRPDFQYITNAGGDKGDPHAMVGGLRFKISL